MARTLCDRCISLRLSVTKFRIQDQSIEVSDTSTLPELTSARCRHGTLIQIKDSAASCKLCELIFDTVRDANISHMDGVECYLLWEIDGRIPVETPTHHKANRTRRLRIIWNDVRLRSYEAYLMLLAPSKYDKSDVDYCSLLNDETHFLGRRIGSHSNKKNLIREFLRLCETCHDSRCTAKLGIEDPFRDTLNEPYFGVIDMENEMLVPLPCSDDGFGLHFAAYATVSYVWGSEQSRQDATRTGNIQDRRKSGGLSGAIGKLPKALRQSISLVHDLGIRYIWIDALCIVQNSSHSWNLNARSMHLIYGNSTITICAADGKDAETGLLALDKHHKQPQMVVDYAEGVCLTLHRPAETSIEMTRWNSRAWTFQERLLSKRCLIFSEGRIFFQCRSTCMSEDIFSDGEGVGWSLDLVQAPLQMLSQLKIRAMWFYISCIQFYTKRHLYEPFDILAAFSGMSKVIEQTTRAPFIFGLPTSHFDLALLWQSVGEPTRLKKATLKDDPKYTDMRFPSWSWCGWKGPGAVYDGDMLGGCLADVHAWISTHTWIDWHIRDGHGTLRRVWDTRQSEEDSSKDLRWRGYKRMTRTQNTRSRHPGSSDERRTSNIKYSESSGESEKTNRSNEKLKIRERPMSMTYGARAKMNNVRRERKDDRESQEKLDIGFTSPTDMFGRSYIGDSVLARLSIPPLPKFTLTLPEDPYNVHTTEETRVSILSSSSEEFPDQPFLQFFTWKTKFHVIRLDKQVKSDTRQPSGSPDHVKTEPEPDTCRCEITDRRGDKCGSLIVGSEWMRKKESERTTEFEFIAISNAKDFTKEEFPEWTYYIPKERNESEWDLYFVLLLEFYPEEGIYRRIALGKVFQAAFTHSENKEWKEIILG